METTTRETSYIESKRARLSDDLEAVKIGELPEEKFIDYILGELRTSFKNGISTAHGRNND